MENSRGFAVKTFFSTLIMSAFLLFVLGCGKKLPDAYGMYADTNKGQLRLDGQGVLAAGNMMSYFAGVKGPSGAECDSLDDLIVYEKDVDPKSIRLVKLQFLKEGNVSAFIGFGATRIRVNLWVPDKDLIDVDVKPVETKRDMYILSPRTHLVKGFYALYIGQFGGGLGSQSRVYDFVVGSVSDYPSYASSLANIQDEVKKIAPVLLDKINHMLNQGEYGNLADVYRPEGKILSGSEFEKFKEGNNTWLASAGSAMKSEVISVKPIDEDSAHCTVKTTYEKAGAQEESVVIRKIGNQYYLTELK
jgi:hypothetical protein